MADVVLITGASSDLGRALLERLANTDSVIYAHHSSK
jgi:NAD(P)-dependent dehydrogenase (short-subunit alcohol dehydrogenase family)